MPTEIINLVDDSDDDLSITPLPKRRKLVPVVPKPSPNKLSELLSVFGARKSHSSVSAMSQTPVKGHRLRGAANISYAESPSSVLSSPRTTSSFDSEEGEANDVMNATSEDELTSDDVIHGEFRHFLCNLSSLILLKLCHEAHWCLLHHCLRGHGEAM